MGHVEQTTQVEIVETDGQIVEIINLDNPEDDLTPRQRRFIDLYFLHNMNATSAAKAAGCKDGPGINVQAHRLLHHEGVQAAIRHRLKAEHMDAVELLRIIARDARGLFGEYLKTEGNGKGELDLKAMGRDGVTHLIDQVVPTKYGTSYKGPSRQRAQEMLIKILGLQITQHVLSGEIKITGTLDERIDQIADLLRGAGDRQATPE